MLILYQVCHSVGLCDFSAFTIVLNSSVTPNLKVFTGVDFCKFDDA